VAPYLAGLFWFIKEMRIWRSLDALDALHCNPLGAAVQCIFDQFQRNALRARYLIRCNPALQGISLIPEVKARVIAR